jgi:hypothetical protein
MSGQSFSFFADHNALQRLFDWLAQSGEDALLSHRAEARKLIVQAIEKEATR